MSVNAHSLVSNVATVSSGPPDLVRAPAEVGKKYWVLRGVAAVLGFVPLLGALSYMPASWANHIEAKAEHESIAEHYRDQLAAHFGIAPDAVQVEHLYQAAVHDLEFSKLLESSARQEKTANKHAAASAGVSFFAGGLGVVGDLVATQVLASASTIFDKDDLTVLDTVDHIDEKRAAGEVINADDIMLLRVSQNPALQHEIRQRHGKSYQKLSGDKRLAVIEEMPDLFHTTMRDASAVNQGLVSVKELSLESAPRPASHLVKQQKSHAKVAQQQSHRARIEERERSMATQQQQV